MACNNMANTANQMAMPNTDHDQVTQDSNNLSGKAADGAYARIEKDARDAAAATDWINETINAAGEGYEPASATDAIIARRGANDLFMQEEAEAMQNRVAAQDEANNLAANMTSGKGGFWFSLCRKLAGTFKNSLAQGEYWALSFAGTAGRNALNNPLVQAMQSFVSDAIGFGQTVKRQFINSYAKECELIGRKTGHSAAEVMEDFGHAANFFHTPEANQHRLARWNEEIAIELAKPENKRDIERVGELQANIKELTENLDATPDMLIDENGNRKHLVSGMYTNGEARAGLADLAKKYGVTEEEMYRVTQPLRDAFAYLNSEARRAGLFTEEDVARLPHFQDYVSIRTRYENSLGAMNDVGIYSPLNVHARLGIDNTPIMDAYSTLGAYTRKLGRAISSQKMGDIMLALARKAKETGESNGLTERNYGELYRMAFSGNLTAMKELTDPGSFGIVVREVVENPDGTHSIVQRLVHWDNQWSADVNGTKFNGAELNAAFNNLAKTTTIPGLVGGMTKATSLMAQMYCRLVPWFAPVNSLRDGAERMNHMGGSEYRREDGTLVAGWKLLPAYVANYTRAGQILLGMLDKSLDLAATPEGELFREYIRGGLRLEYQPGGSHKAGTALERAMLATGDAFGNTDTGKLAGFRDAVKRSIPGRSIGMLMRTLDGWNDYFSNIAGFAQYMTMRKAGIGIEEARAHTLGVMNMYQRGTATPYLRALWPFQVPTAQSIAAMARTFGLAPKADGSFSINGRGVATSVAMGMGIMTALPLMKSSMGKDADGNDKLDNKPLSELSRYMFFGYGQDGDELKVPLGFGPSQIMATLVHGVDRMSRGLMTPEDVTAEVLASTARNVSPADWPAFSAKQRPMEFLTALLTPDVFKPFVETAMNINNFGNPITYHDPNDLEPAYLHGKMRVPAPYHSLSKLAHGLFGADIAPESIEHFITGYLNGPARVFTGLLSQNTLHAAGIDKTNAEILGPWLTAFGLTMSHGMSSNLTMRRLYSEHENLQREINAAGIKLRIPNEKGTTEQKNERKAAALIEAGMDEEKVKRYFRLHKAISDITQESKALKQQGGMENWWDEGDTDYIREQFQNSAQRKHDIALQALQEVGMI